MLRLFPIALFVGSISQPVLAIVESLEFESVITSEKNTIPWIGCAEDTTTHSGWVTPLEDCGIAIEDELSWENRGDFRRSRKVRTEYGWSEMLFTRRTTPPLGRTERPRRGVGIVTSLDIHPGVGAATGSMSYTLVERLQAPSVESEKALLSLDLLGESLDNFSTASVKIYDHDTDELLLSWTENGEPFEINNGQWYTQELDFADRVGHAIRVEFDAVGRTTHRSSWLAAAVFLYVPEPDSGLLAAPGLLGLGLLRNKLRRRRRV